MNCQNIRAAVDASSPREPFSEQITHHLALCQSCGEYAAQMTALLTLMNAAPRVQAPNDFDFRLRARLAQARAARSPQRGLGFFTEFWKQSFSWGQAASALAAVALVVTLSTVYLIGNRNPANSSESNPQVAVDRTPEVQVNNTPSTVPSAANDGTDRQVAPAPPNLSNRTIRPALVANGIKPRGEVTLPPLPVRKEEIEITDLTHQVLIRGRKGIQRVAVQEVSFGVQPTVVAVDHSPRPVQAVF
jgi:hypothetical protein